MQPEAILRPDDWRRCLWMASQRDRHMCDGIGHGQADDEVIFNVPRINHRS
jgi:hypothetical protein